MTDDVKGDLMQRSREWLQSCVNAATRSGVPEEADLEAFILAHLDGEEARQDAAVAAAREEQREACWDVVSDNHDEPYSKTLRALAAMPLTATPLADRIAELSRTLQARVEDWNNERTTVVMERRRANDLEAERDALRAENEELKGWNDERLKEREEAYAALLKAEAQVEAQGRDIHHLVNKALDYATEGKALRAQVATETDLYKASMAEASRAIERLTAQVEAARTLCADFHQGGGLMWPHEVIAAMDGAKPK